MEKFAQKMAQAFNDELQKIAEAKGTGSFVPGMVVGGIGALALHRKLKDMQLGAEMRRQQQSQAQGM